MISAGIRELKDNLSRYIRQVEAGHRVIVTVHGRAVAELVPASPNEDVGVAGNYDTLISAGVIAAAADPGGRIEPWPDMHVPAGTAAHLIDADRGDP
ncbi:MAG: type II toxin-antitoxin system Phd/YefM family antitoxin [Steroidobacteraceae bacterium]